MRIEKYGPDSEKLSDGQLELLEFGISSTEAEAESQRQQLELPLKRGREHPGRQQLNAELPRVKKIIACTADKCLCGKCDLDHCPLYRQSATLIRETGIDLSRQSWMAGVMRIDELLRPIRGSNGSRAVGRKLYPGR